MLLKLLIFKTTLLVAFTSSPTQSCGVTEGRFKCLNGNCISIFQRCDDFDDCGDFSDELDCVCKGGAVAKQFQCANKKCINIRDTCNIKDDCGDASDEIGCICVDNYHYTCRNKRCIYGRNKCDSVDDCGDGSDEENCTCSENSFNCTNGKCLSLIVKCNRENECGDDSDEKDCSCWAETKKCSTGRCVSDHEWCDGKRDCADGTDEKDCDSCSLQEFNFATCFNEVYSNITTYNYLFLRYPHQIYYEIDFNGFHNPTLDLDIFNQSLMCPHLPQLKSCLAKHSVDNCSLSRRMSLPRTIQTLNNICNSSADEPQFSELEQCLILNLPEDVRSEMYSCPRLTIFPVQYNSCSIFFWYHSRDACRAQVLSEKVPKCGTFDYFMRHYKAFTSNVPNQCDYDLLCEKSSNFSQTLCKDSRTSPKIDEVFLKGPEVINSQIQFYCLFLANITNDANYNITFVIDGDLVIYSKEVDTHTRNLTLTEDYFISHLGKILTCQVQSYFTHSRHLIHSVSSNTNYYLGVMAYESMINLQEKGRTSFDLTFYSTLPFLCSPNTYCDLKYNLITGFGLAAESKTCYRTLHALPSVINPPYQPNLKFYLKDNFKITTTLEVSLMHFSTAVSGKIISENLSNSVSNYFINHTFRPLIVRRKDRLHEIGQYKICTVSAYTNVLTFDYLLFYSFRQGIFSYVKTHDDSLEIQLIHKENTVCGVAVREGSVILLADACMDGFPILLAHPFTDLPFGYSIKRPLNNAFELITPSSAIYITLVFEGGINVIIYLEETLSGKVSGLCGNYDGNPYNDIPIENSLYHKSASNSLISSYSMDLNSVKGHESLFFGKTKGENKLSEKWFCRCREGSNDSNVKNTYSGAFNAFSAQEDFYNPSESRSFDFLHTIMNAKETGFRSWVDYKGYPSGYIYPPYLKYQKDFLSNLETKTFQQENKLDRTFAIEACKEYFNKFGQDSICRIKDFEKHLMLEKCSLDVQVSGNVSATSYSTPELLKFCQIYHLSHSYFLNPHRSLDPFLAENQAIEFISSEMLKHKDHSCKRYCLSGVCQMGRCVCNEGFIGQNCGLNNSSVPEIKRVINEDKIDYRDPLRFHEIVVEISGASDSYSDVICFIIAQTLEEKTIFESSAIAFSRGSLFSCPLDTVLLHAFHPRYQGSKLTSKGIPAIKITVAFMHRNHSFPSHLSNNATVIAFDSRCYQCDSLNCSLKQDTCLVDGYCYYNNQANLMDSSETCQPTKATDTFQSASKAASTFFAMSTLCLCIVVTVSTIYIFSSF